MVECFNCSSKNTESICNFGQIPLGYPQISKEAKPWVQDLELLYCKDCNLVQNHHCMPEEQLRGENFYLSVHSKLQDKHNDKLVSYVTSRQSIKNNDYIIEVGCGDGGLLMKFKEKGFNNLVGIDPAPHSNQKYDFTLLNEFFDDSTVKKLRADGIRPKVILANYVLDVLTDVNTFFKDASRLLDDDGEFIFEVTNFIHFFNTMRVDQFAHLRRSWFTLAFLNRSLAASGLHICDIDLFENYRGGTYRLTAKKQNSLSPKVQSFLNAESEALVSNNFNDLRKNLVAKKQVILDELGKAKARGIPVLGYGGGLKASTLVNWLELNDSTLLATFDNDPLKVDRFMPYSRIPIKKASEVTSRFGLYLLLALDHEEEVLEYLQDSIPAGSKIIVPTGSVPKIINV